MCLVPLENPLKESRLVYVIKQKLQVILKGSSIKGMISAVLIVISFLYYEFCGKGCRTRTYDGVSPTALETAAIAAMRSPCCFTTIINGSPERI